MPQSMQKPEIMAPVGGLLQLQAAVRAGADSVYFGLDDGFNARIRANNLRRSELPEVMQFLRDYGVKAYVTLNTLIFDEELERVEAVLLDLAEVGVDALIVQDWGVVSLARNIVPNLPIHGSTQMSITDAAGVRMAEAYGIERVVVGRELSIEEIKKIKADTQVEIEAFAHGALCVSYSGQCFSSEAWGGRSANRGQCAQACRMPYDLVVDGETLTQQDFNYVLSPQDLMGLGHLPQLIEAGVSCLKIEGRLKGPEYVYATVSAYRKALDEIWQKHDADKALPSFPIPVETRRELAQVFSRGQDESADGLTPGFFEGVQHQKLVIGRSPRHRGLYIGKVAAVSKRGFSLALSNPLKRGDGLVFDNGHAERHEPGGNVYGIRRKGKDIDGEIDNGYVELDMGRQFKLSRINVGDLVWRTKDASKEAGLPLEQLPFTQKVPVNISVAGCIGQALQFTLQDDVGNKVTLESSQVLSKADKVPMSKEKLAKAIGQLGDTPFEVVGLDVRLDGDLFLPMGEIKALRREAVEGLLELRRQVPYEFRTEKPVGVNDYLAAGHESKSHDALHLSLLCRTHEQVLAAVALDEVEEIVIDFLEVHGLKEACAAVRLTDKKLVLATPRIFKPGEDRLWLYYCRLEPDALLIRSAGLLWHFNELGGEGALLPNTEFVIPPLYGDFSLNASNVISARLFLSLGLKRLSLTHDLSGPQICRLALGLSGDDVAKIEVIAHHHLPIFHTEHCVFARFLSKGNSYKDCGRPCESHLVHLRDGKGVEHLLQADIGCRNTLFNGVAQSAAPLLEKMKSSGIGFYRIELVDEPAEDIADIVHGYRDVLSGELHHKELWRSLDHIGNANQHQQGVALGSLVERRELKKSEMKRPTAK